MLKLKDVTKRYEMIENNVDALKGISINFRRSEFVSILGPSGCGKTTLLNIIGGLDRYTSGDLIINGVSTRDYKDKDWDFYRNNTIGFVFQSYNLIMHQTILKNIELAMTLSGVSRSECKKRAINALEKVGLKEHLLKKPSQLSGGQMQRVAIARALVNNPSIILADEPTGALDSETSRQIMDLMEDIGKNHLVIMVTHNKELAEEYSTRVINLLDGKVINDTNPYSDEDFSKDFAIKDEDIDKQKAKDKTSMSFATALSLSFDNLKTKKARTFLTSFAGSIGIIGIALVLAISSGFSGYINTMQQDTLSSYPIVIAESTYDVTQLMSQGNNILSGSDSEFVVNPIMSNMSKAIVNNNITKDYIDNVIIPLKGEDFVSDILIDYEFDLNVYNQRGNNDGVKYVKAYSYAKGSCFWTQMTNKTELILDTYELIGDSKLPNSANEIAVVVDSEYRISDLTLIALGLDSSVGKIGINSLLGLELKLIDNNNLYSKNGDRFTRNIVDEVIYNTGDTIKVTAVLRAKSDTDMNSVISGVMYHNSLVDKVLASAKNSDIVTWQLKNPTINPFSGDAYVEDDTTVQEQETSTLKSLNYFETPNQIRIFPVDFKSKEDVIKVLDEYNEDRLDSEKIVYTDSIALMVNTLNTVVDTITYVLIAFISISLVVSSIMIGIITYISVLERTKEIGILRSIGARKKDISRVFNAETLIVGFASGLLGVFITLLISVPINIIVGALTGISNVANLSVFSAIVLIVVSMLLTLIAGLIPAKMATKKDPVEALRQ